MANWEHKVMTEDELKQLVRDVYDQKYFTSLHCRGQVDPSMIFMPVMFLGAAPTKPSFPEKTGNIKVDRKNKLNHITNLEIWEKEIKEWESEEETSKRENYFNNIGMLYESYDKAGPRSINGFPMFFSCKIVSSEDTKKFWDMYVKYSEMRENFEKEWK